jgi:cyclic pyranopterin phosphate synthase
MDHSSKKSGLTHVDQNQNPTMVDVSAKEITTRVAVAEARVLMPKECRSLLNQGELMVKKGPVLKTAIIAGTMAVKKTYELIPFCHLIAIEACKFEMEISDQGGAIEPFEIIIRCEVKTTGKTGVEMEALTGASVAALTVYDMCKAITHEMKITGTRLIQKSGGKRLVLDRPLYGLVLTGGKSSRMKQDKALLPYGESPQAVNAFNLLTESCSKVFLSARQGQWKNTSLQDLPTITDEVENLGPMGGLISAFNRYPEVHWFVVACDLPLVNQVAVKKLLSEFDPKANATCFLSEEGEFPEALFGIYTPHSHSLFKDALQNENRCPVKVLRKNGGKFLAPDPSVRLDNVNTGEEYQLAKAAFT